MSHPAIRVDGLGKRYSLGESQHHNALRDALANAISAPARWVRRRHRPASDRATDLLWAVKDVSFQLDPGEIVGIIGRNGAGKSTLLKLLAQITEPTEGRAELRGNVAALLEVGAGFHPELTGRENVYLNGAILGMRKAEIEQKFDGIVGFSGIARFIDTPVKRYSSGMAVRLAFAVAAHLDPDILLVDEILAVGDAEFQKKSLGRMQDVATAGRTVVFVSHNMSSVLRLCPRVLLMKDGRVVADGPAHDVIRAYLDTGLGTTGAREWPAPDAAPGDDVVRLKAVRVRDQKGAVAEEIDIRSPIDIEVEFWQLRADDLSQSGVVLGFSNEDGLLLFASSTYQDAEWHSRAPQPGLARATCRVPGNFFAEGQITVHVEVNCLQPPARHVQEADVVAFHVVDRSAGDAVRGKVAGDWPGLIRPMLEWRTEVDSASVPHLAT